MKQAQCDSCAHYRHHYILDGKRLVRIFCGHCTNPEGKAIFKSRKPFNPVCDRYLPCPPDQEAFASKEYLSKALLEYVLSLPLLPEIENEHP